MLDYIMRAPQTALTQVKSHILYKQFTQLTGMHASLAISSSVQSVLFSLVLFRIDFDSCSDTNLASHVFIWLKKFVRFHNVNDMFATSSLHNGSRIA
jgi:hypothetical protein